MTKILLTYWKTHLHLLCEGLGTNILVELILVKDLYSYNITVISFLFQNSFQCPAVSTQPETCEMGDNPAEMVHQTSCASRCAYSYCSSDFIHNCGDNIFWSTPYKQETPACDGGG